MTDQPLLEALEAVLGELEASGEIVICRTDSTVSARRLHDAILDVVPDSSLSAQELSGLRSLAFHAIHDNRFFNWEMPTLTGFTSEEFADIIEKLPKV